MDGIRWVVLTHEHQERSVDWYWAFGLIALAGIGVSIYFNNILFALIIALGALSIGILLARGPREHEVHVHERGITLDGTLYPYQSLQSFWVAPEFEPEDESDDEYPLYLRLTTSSYVHPHFTIPLEDSAHASEVREFLAQYLDEVEQQPHVSEHVARLLGL